MRILLILIVVATGAWSAYWFIASAGVKSGFETWFEARRAEGWVAETQDIQVTGFPNRIDISFTDLILADTDSGLVWEAPFFQILALSYRPNHVIAVWPPEQRLATPHEKFTLTSSDMRASIVLRPDSDLGLTRTTLTAEDLTIRADGAADETRLAALTLAAERVAVDAAPTYRLGLSSDGVAPALPRGLRETLPDTLDALRADMTVTFEKPWDRQAIETARPQPRQINIRLAEARWGELELLVAGELDVDENGLPEGSLAVKARNWREILDIAVATGSMPQGLARTLEDGLSLLAGLSGNRQTIDMPLEFRRGRIFLGPVPIGQAPVLRLR